MEECEYKFLSDKDTISKIEQILILQKREMNENIQINYYYDTDNGLLFRNGITLRVRQIEGDLFLQYKRRAKSDSRFFVSEEKNITIDNFNSNIILPFELRLKSKNGFINSRGGCYKFQGSLITHRRTYNVENGIKVTFDRNYYLGTFDCEIEIEFLKEKNKEAENLISKLNLDIPFSRAGKYERFFMRKKELDCLKSDV